MNPRDDSEAGDETKMQHSEPIMADRPHERQHHLHVAHCSVCGYLTEEDLPHGHNVTYVHSAFSRPGPRSTGPLRPPFPTRLDGMRIRTDPSVPKDEIRIETIPGPDSVAHSFRSYRMQQEAQDRPSPANQAVPGVYSPQQGLRQSEGILNRLERAEREEVIREQIARQVSETYGTSSPGDTLGPRWDDLDEHDPRADGYVFSMNHRFEMEVIERREEVKREFLEQYRAMRPRLWRLRRVWYALQHWAIGVLLALKGRGFWEGVAFQEEAHTIDWGED